MYQTTKAILSAAAALALAARMTVALHGAAVTDGPAAAALAAVVSVLFVGTLCLTALLAVTGGGWRPRT